MVHEGRVLGRVEHLEQRRRGVAPHVGPHLVHLVEHQQRVAGLAALQRVDDAAGERPDVGAPVPPHLGLVAYATQRHAREPPLQGLGDALAERRLPHAGRPDEAQDAPLRLRVEGAHGEVLEDALLHRLQVVVVAVQDLPRGLEVAPVLRGAAPRERGERLEIGPRHVVLGRLGRHLAQPLELAVDDLLRLGRDARLLEATTQLVQLVLALVLAQLLADHAQLLAQHVLALVLVETRLDLLLDLAPHLEHLQLLAEQLGQPLEALVHLVDREQLRLGGEGQIDVGGDEVGELAGVGDPGEHFVQLFAQVGRDVDDAGELGVHRALERLGARVLGELG